MKYVCIFIVFLTIAITCVANASTETVNLVVAGERVALRTPCQLVDDAVYIPLEALTCFGATYDTDIHKRDGERIRITGADGRRFSMRAKLTNGELLLPAYDFAEKIGASTDWDPRTVTLYVRGIIQRIDFDGTRLKVATSVPVGVKISDTNWTRSARKLVLDLKGGEFPRNRADLTINNSAQCSINTGFPDTAETARIVIDMPVAFRPRLVGQARASLVEVAVDRSPVSVPTPIQPSTRPRPVTPAEQPPIPGGYAGMDPSAASVVTVTGIDDRITSARGAEVYIKTTGQAKITTSLSRNPNRLTVDLRNARLDNDISELQVGGSLLQSITAEQLDENTVRVNIDLARMAGFDINWDQSDGQFVVGLQMPKNSGGLLSQKVIVIDPGHGGRFTGAVGCSGAAEKTYTYQMAAKVQQLLSDAGACAVLTRKGDAIFSNNQKTDLQKRVEFASNHSADFFISIHCNSCVVQNTSSGTETYYHRGDMSGRALAECIHSELVRAIGLPDRRVHPDPGSGFLVLKNSSAAGIPAVLIEVGFINHRNDECIISDPEMQERIAAAVVAGLKTYIEGGLGSTRAPSRRASLPKSKKPVSKPRTTQVADAKLPAATGGRGANLTVSGIQQPRDITSF